MEKMNILFVDDETLIRNSLERLLRKAPYARHYAKDGFIALEKMAETPIQILVTDMKMPGMDGLTLLQKVKSLYPDTLRIALSAYTMTAQLLPCINTGEIYRFVSKPIVPEELRQSIDDAIEYYLLRKDRISLVKELEEKNKALTTALDLQKEIETQLRKMSVTDALTGLYNRRYLEASFETSFAQSLRYNNDLSCLMLDLDHFKKINDTHGHAFGDFVLQQFAVRLKESIRNADMGFRYGGEEFVVLLPHADIESAKRIAQRILEACRNTPFENGGKSADVTISIGVTSLKTHNPKSPKEMLKATDDLLYKSKTNGRDRLTY